MACIEFAPPVETTGPPDDVGVPEAAPLEAASPPSSVVPVLPVLPSAGAEPAGGAGAVPLTALAARDLYETRVFSPVAALEYRCQQRSEKGR